MPPDKTRQVKADGTCISCDKNAGGACISCFSCEQLIHVVDCTDNEDLVTKTFLDKQWKAWKSSGTYTSVCFICPPCREAKNLQRDIISSNRMAVMEEKVASVQDSVLEIKNLLLREPSHQDFPDLPTPGGNYARKAKVKSSDSVIVIENDAQAQPIDRKILQEASYSSKAAVSSTYQNKQGNTVLICQSEAAKDRLVADLRERVKDRPIKTPAQRLPTIRIAGMEEDFSKDRIFEDIKVKNEDRGIHIEESNFKVLFTRKHAKNPNLFQAIVRVSNEVRAAIAAAGDRINIDLTICKVFDHFHIRRCNQCQGYNHFKDTCTKAARCGNCAGDHQTEDCQSDEMKCANCVDNKYDNTSHKTSDHNCKSYVGAQKKLEQTIGFYKSKN